MRLNLISNSPNHSGLLAGAVAAFALVGIAALGLDLARQRGDTTAHVTGIAALAVVFTAAALWAMPSALEWWTSERADGAAGAFGLLLLALGAAFAVCATFFFASGGLVAFGGA
jgi:hypothetical protein